MAYDLEHQGAAGATSSTANGRAPGKRSLTQSIPARSGAPLPGDVRDRFEGSLGADLSEVRVHTDEAAARSAASVGARAFATGNDICFADNQDQPDDPFGLHLLAHEVAHTRQQGGRAAGLQFKLEVSAPGDAAEDEADRAADAMVVGLPAAVGHSSGGPSIQRADAAGAPKGAILLSYDQVEAVWKAWVRAKKRELRTPPGDPMAAMNAALAPSKKQVGDLNYKNWRDAGGGCTYADEEQVRPWTTEEHAEYQKEHAPKPELPYEMTPDGMREGQQGRIKGYSAKATAIHTAVLDVERQCAKLASPAGAAGVAADIAVGVYGLAYGVGAQAVSTARDTANPVVQGVAVATKGGPEVPIDDAAQMVETASVSVDVMTGKLNDYYQQTRGTYGTYASAYAAFCEARTVYNRASDAAGKDRADDAMSSAIDQMIDAATAYLTLCQSLGIPAKAAGVEKLGMAIQKGMGNAIEVGVDVVAGDAGLAKPVEVGIEVAKQSAKSM